MKQTTNVHLPLLKDFNTLLYPSVYFPLFTTKESRELMLSWVFFCKEQIKCESTKTNKNKGFENTNLFLCGHHLFFSMLLEDRGRADDRAIDEHDASKRCGEARTTADKVSSAIFSTSCRLRYSVNGEFIEFYANAEVNYFTKREGEGCCGGESLCALVDLICQRSQRSFIISNSLHKSKLIQYCPRVKRCMDVIYTSCTSENNFLGNNRVEMFVHVWLGA